MTAPNLKVYSWEEDTPQRSWEVEESRGLAAFNESSSDSSDEEPEPGSQLYNYLLSEHRAGSLSAKQVCIISHWAGAAGVTQVVPLGMPPSTKGTGDFKRTLEKFIQEGAPDTYVVPMPAFERSAGEKSMKQLHCMLPHEMLAKEAAQLNLRALLREWEAPPNWSSHPVVQQAEAETTPDPVIPLSLFVDGVSYAKRDSLLLMSITNLLTGSKKVIAVLRKRILCKCGCRGWESLHAVFLWLRWALEVLKAGRHPEARHDGQPFSDQEPSRQRKAGKSLGFRAAVLQLRADWAEISHTFQVPQWSSGQEPCFLCKATRETVYSQLSECTHRGLPWATKSWDSYEAACRKCETDVELTQTHWKKLKGILLADVQKQGSRGVALLCDYPPLSLRKGDRVEPTEGMLDTHSVFSDVMPARVQFWRRSAESEALRRNPLLSPALGTDLGTVVAIDVLHTLCLGIHAQFALGAMWWYVETMQHPAHPGRHQHMNMEQMAVNYREWAEDMRRQHPAIQITTLGELNQDVIGSKASPALRAKAHETLTLLRWLTVFLQVDAVKALEKGSQWATAAQSLWMMWQTMDNAPMVVPRPVRKDR